jgi:hypothetical protein
LLSIKKAQDGIRSVSSGYQLKTGEVYTISASSVESTYGIISLAINRFFVGLDSSAKWSAASLFPDVPLTVF